MESRRNGYVLDNELLEYLAFIMVQISMGLNYSRVKRITFHIAHYVLIPSLVPTVKELKVLCILKKSYYWIWLHVLVIQLTFI